MSRRPETLPVAVLGATGYVAGELLRLLSAHPVLRLGGAVSRSAAGTPIARTFPHLDAVYPDECFTDESVLEELARSSDRLAVFSATPHAETAPLVQRWLPAMEALGCRVAWVDLSADFRLSDAERWQELYGVAHPCPELIERFTCNVPELCASTPSGPVAHPGCFTTAVSLAAAPLHAMGLVRPSFMVSAVTGATGSGRTPSAGTHHPERHADLRAYKPLQHRHVAEMEQLVGGAGAGPVEVAFVPHSGPFSRGIHATLHARADAPVDAAQLRDRVREFYAEHPFVIVQDGPPRLKDVVGTNLCRLGVFADGDRVVVCSAIDNLTKGAAGGALQWMNRLLDLDPLAGLPRTALGWS